MRSFLRALLLVASAAPCWAAGDFADETCAYPDAARAAKAQGTTLLSYSGSAKGTVEAVKLLASSGNGALDSAALSCAGRWRFDAKSALGARLIGPGRIAIAWTNDANGAIGRRAAIPHSCQQDYPPAAAAAQASGVTRVKFFITTEGRVRDAAVETTSGNADLDTASLECVRYWRYRPASKNGEPVEVPWKADIKWELYEPPMPEQ